MIVEANTGKAHFLPGAEVSGTDSSNGFAPGVMCENGFVEGKIVVPPSAKKKSGNKGGIFVPGKTRSSGGKFEKAREDKDVVMHEAPHGTGLCKVVDGSTLSVVFKKTKPKNGVMITTKTGSHRFIPDGQEIPAGVVYSKHNAQLYDEAKLKKNK